MHHRFASALRFCLLLMILAGSLFQPQSSAYAAPTLTITPLTWNIIGLDSNTPASGPYLFPVGARVCAAGATTVTAKFNWDDGNNLYTGDPYINLRSTPSNSQSTIILTFTAAGCQDAYFEVQVSKVAGAYDKTRRYYITAENPGGADLVSTPRPRELYVEHLISQNRNSVTDVKLNGASIPAGGTMTLMVGNTYTIDLVGGTATQGYSQFESFINFPNTIFQIISKTANTPDGVLTAYAANNSPYISGGAQPVTDYQGLYADACKWENNPGSPNYRSCVGGDYKTGGAPVTTTYTIKVIGGAGTTQTLNSLLYDFSGSSFHYNSDASTGVRFAEILGPSSVTITKSFSPKAIAPAGTSTMTIKLSNPTAENMTGVHFVDTFPTSPAAMTVTAPVPSNPVCGGTLQDNLGGALGAGDAGIQLVNGTLAANTTCTITVNVTVPSNGTYTNTTGNLFINLGGTDTDTGNNASDSLTAASAAACTPGATLVTWTVPVGATNPPDTATGGAGSPTVNNTGFAATASAQTPARTSIDNIGTNDAASWLLYNLQTGNYIQFVVDTRYYSGVTMTFNMKNPSVANGPTTATVSYNNGTGFTNLPAGTLPIPGNTNWTAETISFAGLTSTTGTTTFRIAATGAKNDNSGAGLNFDEISFTGCAVPTPAPTIAKTFRNAAGTADVTSIQKSATSVLRFTISNTATGNRALTGISFTDTLPLGLDVVSSSAARCGGTLTVTNNVSPTRDTISLSGGSLAAGGSCTFDVNVTGTTAGQYDNVTGYISSTQSGTSTNYAEDTLDVIAPPILAKAFNLSTILTGGTSTLSFTITNPNNFTSLSGIGFTDTLPAGVTATNGTTNNVCGAGSSLVITGGNLLTITGASLLTNGTCTFSVPVTGTTSGTKNNTTSVVTSTEGGNGSAATATLVVNTPVSLIGLNKQISTDNTNWFKYVGIIPTQNIWYKFTITNDGETGLDGINLSDSGYNLTSCTPALPVTLALGASASCVLGPISITSAPTPNPFTNTATVTTSTYTSVPPVSSSAKYGTESLSIVKNATETYFTAAGDLLHYSYTVTNNGGYPLLGPVTVSDDMVGAVSCQDPTAVGNNNAYLDPGETVACPAAGTVTYTVQAADVTAKLVTNTAHSSANGIDSPNVSKTIPLVPDLSVSKINSITGNTTAGSIILGTGTFDWTLIVANSANAGPASFANAQTILTDTLPTTGATYAVGTVTYAGGTTGTVACSIDGVTFVLTCTANGAVTVPTGASFNVPISVTPEAVGSLVNPKTVGGSCQVDPGALVVEMDETNNACNSNTVTVLAPPILTLQKTVVNDNGGTALDTAWTLSATQGATTISGVEGDNAITNAAVAVGTWTLAESGGPSGYTPGTWSCAGAADVNPNDVLTLTTGETVTCTITNNDNAPSLTLVKTLTNNDGGVATVSDWTLTATGASGTPTNLSGASPVTSGPLFKADTYTLAESGVPTGYTASAWSCTNGVTVTTNQITLGLGQSTTCTINNDDQPATLTLQKTVVNDNGGTAVDTAWTLQAAGPVTISGAEGVPAVTNAPVSAGTYTLSEFGGPTGYTTGTWSCTNGVTVTGNQITLGSGQNSTCTITNDDNAPSLTLLKTVTNDNGGTAAATEWTLTAAGASGAPTDLNGTTPVISGSGFKADTYTLGETGGRLGYSASTWSCTNGVTVSNAQITLGLGQSTVCTINNDDIAPSLTLVKTVINDNSGTNVETDWTLTANGSSNTPTNLTGTTPVTSGPGFQADVYTLDETGPAGYTASAWSCTNGVVVSVGQIKLDVGQTTTCTIDNNDNNQLPTANPDTNNAVEGGPVVPGNVLSNDSPGDVPTPVTSANQGANTITLGTPFTTAAGGTLILNGDGTYSYTPPAVLPEGGALTEVFDYTITDTDGDTSSSTLTITIDRLPQANPDTNTATEGGPAVTGNTITNDDQGNIAATVTAADQGGTAITIGAPFTTAAGGSLTLNADGSYSYTPPAQGNVPPAGLTEVFNYTITDVDGDSSSSTLTITVSDNDLFPTANPDTNSATEGGPAVTGDVRSNDILGDTPTLVTAASQGLNTITLGTPFTTSAGGTLTLNADGTYSYTPPASLPEGDSLTEVFNYTITDADGDPSSSTLTISVDRLPQANPDTNTALEGGPAVTGNTIANDDQGNVNATVTSADQGGTPITIGVAFTTSVGGSLTLNADGSYSYTPPAQGSVPPGGLTEVFNYTITDTDGDTSSSTLTITVNDNDLLPTANPDTNSAVEGGAAVPGNVLSNDSLGDTPTLVTSAGQGVNAITLGTPFTTAAGGTLTLNADGTYSYTPPATLPEGSVLTEVFTYTITDADGDPSSSTLTITVDRLPQANPDTNSAVGSGPAVTGNTITNDDQGNTPATVTAGDQGGMPITIGTAFTTAAGGSLTLNADGSYSYTPPPAVSVPPGGLTETFNYTITDVDGDTSSSTLTITVAAVPTITAVDDNDTTSANTPVTTIVTTNDINVGGSIDPNSVQVTVPPTTGSVVCTGASCVYTPPAGFAGTVTYTYQVCLAAPFGTTCATAVVTIDVTPTINAVDDDYTASPINGFAGGTTASVIGNDTTNGVTAAPGTNVTLTPGTAPAPTAGSITMNPDGTITVAAGTTAGTYTYPYTICTNPATIPATCDSANAIVVVSAAPILAVDDNAGPVDGLTGATNVLNVFTNDKLNGVAVNLVDVTLTRQPGGSPELTLNPNGSVDVAAGTPAGSYSFDYQICEKLNPTNCSIATVTVSVGTPAIDAINDSGSTINGAVGGQSPANVLTNDTLNGTSPVLLADVNLTQVSTTNASVTLNPLDGSVNVAAGTPSGSYVVTYKICDKVNPTNCDTATVTVPVNAPSLELAKTNNATSVTAGGTTTYELTVTNKGTASTNGTITVVDVLPAGMSIADGAVTLDGTNAANWTCNSASNVITCTSNSVITASETSTFNFTVDVSVNATGTQLNKAKAGGGGDPSNPNPPTNITAGQCTGTNTPKGCATDTDGTGAPLVADPALSKSANPLQASVGDTVTFTLLLTNQGTAAASGVVVTDALPSMFDVTAVHVIGAPGAPGSTLVNVTPAIGTGPAPYTVVVTLGANLGLTDVVVIQIVTRVNAQASFPTSNRAGLTTDGSNRLLTNDSASATVSARQSRTPRPRTTTTLVLPLTGFARDVTTPLKPQPSNLKYLATDLVLEIPSLGVKIPIVGVPKKDNTWNVSWLADQAGWLQGTAFPSWNGNSVLTGHVYLPSGLPGPFVNLSKMKFGDQIIIRAYGQKYTFEVQSNQILKPDDASIVKHEEKSWLTLVTCKDYDETAKTYKNRVVVHAVLVKVASDK